MPHLDPAIIAAAIGARQGYEDVARAVANYQAGERPLPGTRPYDAVVAWRAATHAIRERKRRECALFARRRLIRIARVQAAGTRGS